MTIGGSLRFSILGPLEIRGAQGVVRIRSAKQRALLAVLLLHANEVVSVEHLVDELWGEHPPTTAQKLVQGYVHALRRTLGGDTLDTQPPGYRVSANARTLDLLEFDELVGHAESARPADSAALLRRAIALWRGPPLADVALEGEDRHKLASLGDRRLTTQIELIESDLELGLNAQLVGELEVLAAEHPYQERIAALLMLALYRAGRQADALEVYRAIRRRLNDELGLEPGQELRDLESAILRHEPGLSLAPPAASAVSVPEPRPDTPGAQATRVWVSRRYVFPPVVVLLAAAILGALVLFDGNAEAIAAPANSLAVVDSETNRVVAAVEGLIRPGPVAAGAGAIWVGNLDDRTLARIDPETRAIVKTISLKATPDGLAVEDDAVWVAHGRLGLLTKIDPRFNTVVETIPVASRAISFPDGSASVGFGAVWAAYGDSTLARVRPGPSVRSTTAGTGPAAVVTAFGSIWVSLSGDSLVRRYNPLTFEEGAVAEYPVGRSPTGMAADEGAIWVACTDDDFVFRVDPGPDATSTLPIGVGRGPSAVAAGSGSVWVANTADGTLTRIAPETNTVAETIEIGNAPAGVAVADGLVWISVQAP